MDPIKKLREAAEEYGIDVEQRGLGHYQIKGPLLVNYYPTSKNRTAHINNTRESRKNVSPVQAVKMSMTLPPLRKLEKRRKGDLHTRKRRRWLKDKPWCYWCGDLVTEETATIDHVIPLSRGGIDNCANMVLACYKCNQWRGNDMPEVFNDSTADIQTES